MRQTAVKLGGEVSGGVEARPDSKPRGKTNRAGRLDSLCKLARPFASLRQVENIELSRTPCIPSGLYHSSPPMADEPKGCPAQKLHRPADLHSVHGSENLRTEEHMDNNIVNSDILDQRLPTSWRRVPRLPCLSRLPRAASRGAARECVAEGRESRGVAERDLGPKLNANRKSEELANVANH
jgi:hypothetical protein